ncbi:hypothetical protein BCR34DRAFT_582550 [Clohesyomyces aquaticus]|uniref:Uncharacterized protein n=1 Tax=Clohesyomyces aquaticus TaxID=1231657 RepID=A0A1Y2A8Z7_9PLEO|nr:hypothetical protein BCR34DRAFT_582550 [Clohesyomyces aquaticus]
MDLCNAIHNKRNGSVLRTPGARSESTTAGIQNATSVEGPMEEIEHHVPESHDSQERFQGHRRYPNPSNRTWVASSLTTAVDPSFEDILADRWGYSSLLGVPLTPAIESRHPDANMLTALDLLDPQLEISNQSTALEGELQVPNRPTDAGGGLFHQAQTPSQQGTIAAYGAIPRTLCTECSKDYRAEFTQKKNFNDDDVSPKRTTTQRRRLPRGREKKIRFVGPA